MSGSGGNGDEDFLGESRVDDGLKLISVAEDGHALDQHPKFFGIVVDEADDRVFRKIGVDLSKQHDARVARADDKDVLPAGAAPGKKFLFKPHGEAHGRDEDRGDHHVA